MIFGAFNSSSDTLQKTWGLVDNGAMTYRSSTQQGQRYDLVCDQHDTLEICHCFYAGE